RSGPGARVALFRDPGEVFGARAVERLHSRQPGLRVAGHGAAQGPCQLAEGERAPGRTPRGRAAPAGPALRRAPLHRARDQFPAGFFVVAGLGAVFGAGASDFSGTATVVLKRRSTSSVMSTPSSA